jgi:putative hemolysin
MDFGWATYLKLAKNYLVEPALRTVPLPELAIHPSPAYRGECPPPPKLLRAYLAIGGKICGPPAIDREFKTIDFLTLADLTQLPSAVREHFFGQEAHDE